MFKSYKYRIYPTKKQEQQILQNIGACRWVYNYGLEKKTEYWIKYRKNLSKYDISKDLTRLKLKKETDWLNGAIAQSLQTSLEHLDHAYKAFFKQGKSYPKFKKKNNSKQSFSLPQYSFVDFEKGYLKILKIGKIRAAFSRTFIGKIKTVTISKTPTNKYFASILVDVPQELPKKKLIKSETAIGLDLGLKDFIVMSNGEKVKHPKIYQKYERKLKRLHRKLSRKMKGSKNRQKAKFQLARLYEKITNTRNDFLHKLSHKLTHENQVKTIVVENLSVSNMIKNRKLSKSIVSSGWSTFVNQLRYKCDWYGINFIQIGRFEPSSKTCSNCGSINKELKLEQRKWTCQSCNTIRDRDINAAVNIKQIGLNPKIKVPMDNREFTPVESRCNKATHRNRKFLVKQR